MRVKRGREWIDLGTGRQNTGVFTGQSVAHLAASGAGHRGAHTYRGGPRCVLCGHLRRQGTGVAA